MVVLIISINGRLINMVVLIRSINRRLINMVVLIRSINRRLINMVVLIISMNWRLINRVLWCIQGPFPPSWFYSGKGQTIGFLTMVKHGKFWIGFLLNLFNFGCVDLAFGNKINWFLIPTTFIDSKFRIFSLCACLNFKVKP